MVVEGIADGWDGPGREHKWESSEITDTLGVTWGREASKWGLRATM